MKIDILLPYKEIYSSTKASAVSLTVKNSMEFSEFKSNIKIYGQSTSDPISKDKFVGLKIRKIMHLGNNRSILINYLNLNNLAEKDIRIIEFHNRPYIFNLAIKKIKKNPISLHYHNDPTTMRGSKTIDERINIANKAAAVYFVSEFIKKKFLEGIKEKFSNLYVLPNGIQRRLATKPNKKKDIIFIGRLVPEKGAHLFVQSISKVIKDYPDWNFKIIGTAKAGQNNLQTKYEKDVIQKFKTLGKNAYYLGFISNNEVQDILKSASILVIPSLWDDPFPLTALEGLSNGAAIIASRRGGLVEMLQNKGMLIDNISEKKLENSIIKFISDKKLLLEYQDKSWSNYIYNQSSTSKLQDSIRRTILNNFYNINN
jgi:glycosyltransferase involved in cell wall biosynthesis